MNYGRYFLMMLFVLLGITTPAWAYVGPGAGLTAIGAALALVAAMVLAVIGFIWYPIKQLWRRMTGRRTRAAAAPVDDLRL